VIFRRRFGAVVSAQLDLFEREHADLLRECDEAERAYDASSREDAPERYEAYQDLVETGAELLVEMRDTYARTLGEDAAETYVAAFDRTVARRLRRFTSHLDIV
jgi:hypothetical protein